MLLGVRATAVASHGRRRRPEEMGHRRARAIQDRQLGLDHVDVASTCTASGCARQSPRERRRPCCRLASTLHHQVAVLGTRRDNAYGDG